MANQVLLDSQLRLVFDMGVDEKGKIIFKNKNYNNIKTSATADELLSVAQAIVSLQTETLSAVERNNSNQIMA
ncbi:DUF1659 domain-containing protein [Metabacillus litoralis]|uniref:DUF1659 domain-containing protein n=1 Tax=Metabacillus litoralis TaxID=152268 RepID=A0A5C6V9T4_9BACI|nr:DUF1659 domain-containing protein [Metabacillus litoralis]TXC82233.1 DUF1659 domain-containing protein [Metabacillus litoralis]